MKTERRRIVKEQNKYLDFGNNEFLSADEFSNKLKEIETSIKNIEPNISEVKFGIGVEYGYYDSVDLILMIETSRLENDVELEKRLSKAEKRKETIKNKKNNYEISRIN
jgi:hypothetical protein